MRWRSLVACLALGSCRMSRPPADPEILCSRDGGDTWVDIGPRVGSRYGVAGIVGLPGGEVYAVGDGAEGHEGRIFHSPDGGKSWTEERQDAPLRAIWGHAGGVWAVGDSGLVVRGRGRQFEVLKTGHGDLFRGVWGASPDDVYVAGTGGVLHTTDGGRSWTKFATRPTMSKVWGSGPGDVHVVGYEDTVLHSTDGGRSWARGTTGTGANLLGVWGRSPREIYVAGGGGVIARSEDGGASWRATTSGVKQAVWAITGTAERLFAVADDGVILRSRDGQVWSQVRRGDPYHRMGIWAGPKGLVYAVGMSLPRLPEYNIK